MNFEDVASSIATLDDDAVEQFLFDCLERRFGRAKLQTSDYTFNLTLPAGYRVLTPCGSKVKYRTGESDSTSGIALSIIDQ